MEIETQALTACEVAADGVISLGFLDSGGKPATIRLSLNQVGALAMTLPRLIDKALQAPPRPGRQIADTGRKEEARALLEKIKGR